MVAKTYQEAKAECAAKQKARYERLKAAGLCVWCAEPAGPTVLCEPCRLKNVKTSRRHGGFKPWRPGAVGRRPVSAGLAWLDAIGNL